MTAQLTVESLRLGYGGADIVKDLSLMLPAGKISVIVGANGCGKSTLLRGLSRLLAPRSGRVLLDGEDVHRLAPRALARRVALLPQSPVTPEALTVRELVAHGRAPYRSALRREGAADRAAIENALAATHLEGLAGRVVADLSGGQRQRAWIAMALAQETEVLLLDEPTTFLDLAHQVDVLQTVWELNARHGTTVVMVLHDLNLAARYAHHLVALKDGELVAQGAPSEVVTVPIVREVLGLETVVLPDPVAGTPMVVPRAGAAAAITRGGPAPAPGSAAASEATLAFRCVVRDVVELGPGLRRLLLGGPDLAHFGTGSAPLDLRFKLIVPSAGATAASIGACLAPLLPDAPAPGEEGAGWYRLWLQAPESERGVMRTYTVRRVSVEDGETRVAVDVVLHGVEDGVPGEDCGPAAAFAATARPGDVVHAVGPNVHLTDASYGGIDFRPGPATELLLAGDETAAPAICGILAALPRTARGHALIEVPDAGQAQPVSVPDGVSVRWLVRAPGAAVGSALVPAVRTAAPEWAASAGGSSGPGADPEDVDVDGVTLWETPETSASGGYAWIAGEAGVVKELRRYLVRDLGVDRGRVAFMGYWREGRPGN